MEKTIEIPEGYEARIEGNKVILERKESEDEGIRKFIIACIDELRKANAENAEFNDRCSESIAYLERQKEQKPSEWSEEDKLHLNNAILSAEKEWGSDSYTSRWLKSLPDNYKKCNSRWKPSEEQMRAVFDASERNDKLGFVLRNLYDDLKKL